MSLFLGVFFVFVLRFISGTEAEKRSHSAPLFQVSDSSSIMLEDFIECK